ncbi:MAG: methionyl-tRNA formyltransferase [Alphaproteobacteria bacterium]
MNATARTTHAPLRVFVVTQEDCLFLPRFLDTVLSARRGNVVGMTILPTLMPKQTWSTTLRDHLELYGPAQFLKQSFRYAWRRGLGILGERLPLPGVHSVAAVARRHGVPIFEATSVNAQEYLDRLRALDLDVILSVNASQKFRRAILDLPRMGCINVHGALLPRYRGRLPSFWVLVNGEKETGATVHYMNEELDDGPILLQERVAIEPGDTQDDLIAKTKSVGARLVVEAIGRLERGETETIPNDRSQATYHSFPTREDGLRLRRQGRRFL